jgi:CelD/BcsL family acetyltransferase involved in cellulose biosynthesis
MIAARIVREADALEALVPAWWDLWRRTAATPFQSPAWLLPWWRVFGPGRLLTIATEARGRLVGLAPCYVEDGALGRRLLPLGIGISDYLDVLLDPPFAAEAGRAIVEAAEAADGWDCWEWEDLKPGAAALGLPCPAGAVEGLAPQVPCPTLRLDPEGLDAILPKAKRRKLNLARNRSERRGGSIIERACAVTVKDGFDHLVRLHGFRWQALGGDGVLADDQVQSFHRLAGPLLQDSGLLRLYTLRFGGDVVAAYYGFCRGGSAFAYLTGFDPARTFESPGVLLTAHAIAEAIAEGAREFHFLRGGEAYKYGWGAVDRWNQRRSFRRRSPRHAAA